MVTTDLGACEWFVWDLRRSNIIDRGQLDQVVGGFIGRNPGAEPPALAAHLVSQNLLTQFQADRILQGKTQGFVLGPYSLMDALGAGSMGTVYKAQNKNDQKWYAVKVLPRRSMWNVRLAKRKVRVFEDCQHPAVVPFVDVGTSGGMHYLAWPLVEGETLDKVVLREGKLPPDVAASYILQTAEALEKCHSQGLFHGLLKPSNLMIDANQQLHILDIGIGALLAETEGESLVDTMSTANSVASGLDCASPESVMDPTKLTPAGDQYSLGCTLYFCLAGRFPFTDETAAAKMVAHQVKQPPSIKELAPDTPDDLVAIVERLMQKAPEARFASTTDVIAVLSPLARKTSASPQRPTRAASRVDRPEPSRSGFPHPEEVAPSQGEIPPRRTAAASPALPTRQSMQMKGAANPSAPPPAPIPTRPPAAPASGQFDTPIPGMFEEDASNKTLEERLGPVGIAIVAILVCGAAWFLFMQLF
jgi:serine/threonine-protein kinase